MEKIGLNEIRKKYLDFFKSKGHIVLKSFSLIPENDNSLLLINAGMAPLKDYFTGDKKLSKNRATSSQKCIRTADIERVGKTKRHGTFFEMLGNFSFGDYFKKEAIFWAYEFLTKNLGIDKNNLWISVYESDEEAYNIWKNEIKFPEERIVKLGKEDNFWELEIGPCGPSSEIYVDRGEKYGCGKHDCKPGCDCDRFLEIWNLVFTQFNKKEDGKYEPLKHPNIDTGMGLERIALVLEDVDNIFEVDLIKNIISKIEKIASKKYNSNEKDDVSIRIIADHSRAMTFLVSDGVVPGNEGRGYVLRRIIRRAVRHGKLLGISKNFLKDIVFEVIKSYKEHYFELFEEKERIFKIIDIEEKKFNETLDSGLNILNDMIKNLKFNNKKTLSGNDAFKLYDTYGFPLDLSKEILEEEGLSIDEEEFNKAMNKQKERSRASRSENNLGFSKDHSEIINSLGTTKFLGYEKFYANANLKYIIKDDKYLDNLSEGDQAILVFNQSPFYGEGGGQIGDTGIIKSDNAIVQVIDTKKNKEGAILHISKVINGSIKVGEVLNLHIDEDRRRDIKRNHTATHILHKALKKVLGDHIKQMGSYVGNDRLRFDISHFESIREVQLNDVENIVNEQIGKELPVNTKIIKFDESQKEGFIGQFEDKYQENVRAVAIGDKNLNFSKELCGGTHVSNTSEILMFKIISESSVASGIRRIEAITGKKVYEFLNDKQELINKTCYLLKTDEGQLLQRIESKINEAKELENRLFKMQSKANDNIVLELINSKKEINGINVIVAKLENINIDSAREISDKINDKLKDCVIVLAIINEDKLNFTSFVSKTLVKKGLHAGNIVREVAKITGGNGGGRADIATAGGKDIDKVNLAIEKVYDILRG